MLDLNSSMNLKTVSNIRLTWHTCLLRTPDYQIQFCWPCGKLIYQFCFEGHFKPSKTLSLTSLYGHWLSDFYFSGLCAFAQSSCSRCWLKVSSGNHLWHREKKLLKLHYRDLNVPYPVFHINFWPISRIPVIWITKFKQPQPMSHQFCPEVSSIPLTSRPHSRRLPICLCSMQLIIFMWKGVGQTTSLTHITWCKTCQYHRKSFKYHRQTIKQ